MGDDLMPPEGMPISDPQRVGESELLGAEWRFEASLGDGRPWREFATMLTLEDRFPAERAARPSSAKTAD